MNKQKLAQLLAKAGVNQVNYFEKTIRGDIFEKISALLDKSGVDARHFVDLYQEDSFYDDEPSEWTPTGESMEMDWDQFLNHIIGVQAQPPVEEGYSEVMEEDALEEAPGDVTRSIDANMGIAMRAIENLQSFVAQLPKGKRRDKMSRFLVHAEENLVSASTYMPETQADNGGDLSIDVATGYRTPEEAKGYADIYGLTEGTTVKLTRTQMTNIIKEALKTKK
jgi:hypothetical protein